MIWFSKLLKIVISIILSLSFCILCWSQELALCTLMKLVEAEGHTPLKKMSAKHLTFPTIFFEVSIFWFNMDNCEQP